MVLNLLFQKKFTKKPTQPIIEKQEDFSLKLFSQLDDNLHNIKEMLDNPSNLIMREFTIGNTHHRCAVVYIDGLTNNMVIYDQIIKHIQSIFVEMGENRTEGPMGGLVQR